MFLINPYILGGGAVGNPLWDGLQAYYTADNTPNDALGNYNGTLVNGATYGTGIINQGFSLDGVNDYVDLGNVLDFDGSTPFSVSCWINQTSNKAVSLISKQGASPAYTGWRFSVTANGQIQVLFISDYSTNDRLQVTTGTSSFSYGVFNMLTLTYDGSKNTSGITVYVNGTSVSFSTNANSLTGSMSNAINCKIGTMTALSYYFNGIIDDVGIWNRELTSTEVTELYNSGAGKQYPVVRDFLTATGITDSTIVSAINTLTSDLQSYGIWDKLEAIYPFVGGTAETHRYNLKDATQYRIDWNGTITHDSNGVTGDGSTGYGNTNFNDSLFLNNYISFGVYSRTDLTSGSALDIGSGNGPSGNMIGSRFSASGAFNTVMDGTAKYIPTSDSLGLFCANRTSTTDRQGYKNGVESTFTSTQSGYVNRDMYILARNNNNTTVDYYSSRNLAFAFIGNSLTTTEHANLYTAVQAFQTTLSRNV